MISHKHQCIFIHIPKTAGMSIEDAFLRSLNLRFYKGQCPALLLSYNQDFKIGPPSLAHLKPAEYVAHSYLSQDLFNSYFKFTFIRNPWARVVSIYRYFKYHRMLTFEDFMEHRFPQLWEERYDFVMPQVKFIFDEEGNRLVDFVGKFENLKSDFETVKKQVQHPVLDLKHINKPPLSHNWYSRWNMRFLFNEIKQRPELLKHINLFNPITDHYREFYTEKAKKQVYAYYKEDIDKLGYEF